MRPPLRFPEPIESSIVLALGVAFFAATLFMGAIGRPMENATSPSGILGYELAGSRARAAAILAAWDPPAREAARTQTLWDCFLYIPVYVLALSAWAGWCARRLAWPALPQLGVGLAWAMFAAGAFDMVENRQLLAQLASGADGDRAALAARCAQLKFAIAYATSAYVALGSVAIGVRAALRGRGVGT